MAEERVSVPKFSGDEDDFCIWIARAEIYARRFAFGAAMQNCVEVNLPAMRAQEQWPMRLQQ
jgi:hypothetical protein